MRKEEFEELLRNVINDYIIDEETYDDNAQLCIVPEKWEVYVADSREVDVDAPEIDCYDVMDFVEMDAEAKWKVNEEAVEEVASEYF